MVDHNRFADRAVGGARDSVAKLSPALAKTTVGRNQQGIAGLSDMRPHRVRSLAPFSRLLAPLWRESAAPFWGSFSGPDFGAALNKVIKGGPILGVVFWT